MKFRGLDQNQDWMFGQGVGSYAQKQAAIALDIATRLRLWRGSCFFAVTVGVDYTNLLEKGQLKNLIAAMQNNILQTPGVVKLLTFNYAFNPATRRLAVGPILVQTVYSQLFVATIENLLSTPPVTG